MAKMLVNGLKIDYALDGAEGAPVLVLAHSLATSKAVWRRQIGALGGRFRLLSFDVRGHGGSPLPPRSWQLEHCADDVAELIMSLGITKAAYIGLSLGGMIGQIVALRHPGLISKLVLCSTSSRTAPEGLGAWDERIRLAREDGMESLVAGTINRWFSADFQHQDPAAVEQIRGLIRATPVEGYIAACQAIKAFDVSDRIQRIAAPTLVIAGERDQGTPVAVNRAIAEAIPGARFEVLPGALHLANIEAAEAFNHLLLDFLQA